MRTQVTGLELLRGLCALLVACYHGLEWTQTGHFAQWGFYGVYVFFAISGAVLYYNYADRISIAPEPGKLSVAMFLWRRFARLVPLFAACVIFPGFLHMQWNLPRDYLNSTFLFGIASPGDTSAIVGGWSLGIEFTFYALFPMLLFVTTTRTNALIAIAALVLARLSLTSLALSQDPALIKSWGLYTQPAAFLLFFVGGMIVARFMTPRRASISIVTLAFAGTALLFGYPEADNVVVMLGARGVFYSLLTIGLVAAFFWSTATRPATIICEFFGTVSYGVYLLHPFVWFALKRVTLTDATKVVAMLITATMLAWVSAKFYEAPCKRLLLKIAR